MDQNGQKWGWKRAGEGRFGVKNLFVAKLAVFDNFAVCNFLEPGLTPVQVEGSSSEGETFWAWWFPKIFAKTQIVAENHG